MIVASYAFKFHVFWRKMSPCRVLHDFSVPQTVLATQTEGKGKAIDFTSPRTSSDLARQPYETVPIGRISSPSAGGRKLRGKTTRHWL